jgi:hypothetical protein
MLPMMASLPLMVAWCRAESIAAQAIVALHLAAMFGPALVLQRWIVHWSTRQLSAVCALFLAAGALLVVGAATPWNLLGLAFAHGAAWGLAWAGQLWAPDRRSRAGASPWRAAVGYAMLTLAFGGVVALFGAEGVAAAHVALGLAAAGACWFGAMASARTSAPSVGDARARTPGGDRPLSAGDRDLAAGGQQPAPRSSV